MFTSILNETFLYLLLAVNFSVISIFLLSRVRQLQQRLHERDLATRQSIERLSRHVMGLSNRLQLTEKQLDRTSQKQEELKVNKTLETHFSQANKLLDLGIDRDQLVHNFGMSEAEANLMSLVHKQQDTVAGKESVRSQVMEVA